MRRTLSTPFLQILMLAVLILFSSCVAKNKVTVTLKNPKKNSADSTTPTPTPTPTVSNASVSSVQIVNHQLIIHGTGLTDVTGVEVNGNSITENFSIESITATQIIANSIHAFSFDVAKVFNLILSDANASATFTIDFSLCNSTLNGHGFDCSITANDKEVLSFDSLTGKWKPRAMNGLSYKGS